MKIIEDAIKAVSELAFAITALAGSIRELAKAQATGVVLTTTEETAGGQTPEPEKPKATKPKADKKPAKEPEPAGEEEPAKEPEPAGEVTVADLRKIGTALVEAGKKKEFLAALAKIEAKNVSAVAEGQRAELLDTLETILGKTLGEIAD